MAVKERSRASSQRQNWQNTFSGLVQMIRYQQSQLETLAKDRQLLEDRVRIQNERWTYDIRLLEDQISQMKGDLEFQELAGSLQAAKFELVLGLKQREGYLTKLKLEYTDSELEGFKGWFDLYNKFSDLKGGGEDGDKRISNTKSPKKSKQEKQRSKQLEDDLRRLKQQYDKLASEKSSEVSALLAEKKFVWNQYKIMEENYTTKLRSKHSEVEQAEANIQNFLAHMEHLQSSNKEKDGKVAILISKIAKMESDSNKLKEEVSKLSTELDLLRKSTSASSTPLLNHCTAGTRTYSLRGNNSAKDRTNVTVKKDSSAAQLPDPIKDTRKGSSISKRKIDDVITISETPKLFSSRFKVPKLKNASPGIR
ncbi:PREDICTED: uncharacterized protein LOC103321246 [Prunus mume]|uniref:Uncharacterized protein LOC103321246 n=1 Tax=Prunus mume TaxID=102107 RepID=A0ABM0N912_PRUMU|nr:PREDICTED: uncharacterized protein LOC103321246 [Prunus mume]